MKQVQIFLITALLFCSSFFVTANASEYTVDSDPVTMSLKISKMLINHELDLKKDVSAKVLFAINKDNEIVVLSVETENKNVASFIKKRLNYKKIGCEVDTEIKEFKLPVTLKAKA